MNNREGERGSEFGSFIGVLMRKIGEQERLNFSIGNIMGSEWRV